MVRQNQKVMWKGKTWTVDSRPFAVRGKRHVVLVKGKSAFSVPVRQIKK